MDSATLFFFFAEIRIVLFSWLHKCPLENLTQPGLLNSLTATEAAAAVGFFCIDNLLQLSAEAAGILICESVMVLYAKYQNSLCDCTRPSPASSSWHWLRVDQTEVCGTRSRYQQAPPPETLCFKLAFSSWFKLLDSDVPS